MNNKVLRSLISIILLIAFIGCSGSSRVSSFISLSTIEKEQVNKNATIVQCQKKRLTVDEYSSIINSLIGEDYRIYRNFAPSKEYYKNILSTIQESDAPINLDSCTTYLNDMIEHSDFLPEGELISLDNSISSIGEICLEDENHSYHYMNIEQDDMFLSYFKNKNMVVVGRDMCVYNEQRAKDSQDQIWIQWAFPKDPALSYESAQSKAEQFVETHEIKLSLLKSEPCTIIYDYVNRSYGWRFYFTKEVDGLFSKFDDGKWYYVNPKHLPDNVAPWSQEMCVIVVDCDGICEFIWQGASVELNRTNTALNSDYHYLNNVIKKTIIDVYTTSLPEEKGNIDIIINNIDLGISMIETESGDGVYVPSWYVDFKYKWETYEDKDVNWENDLLIINAISCQYIEPRITKKKLLEIKEISNQ